MIKKGVAPKPSYQIRVTRQQKPLTSCKASLALYVAHHLQPLKRLVDTRLKPMQGRASSISGRWTSGSPESRSARKGSLLWS